MSSTPTAESVLAACEAITKHASPTSNPFNLDTDILTSLQSVHDALATQVLAQRLAALSLKGRVADKDAALAGAGRMLAIASKIALSSFATDAELRTIGLSRPAKPVRPTSIPQPTGLVATGLASGAVRLAWSRNGNAYGASFAVEWSPDGLAWEMVEVTTRASLVLAGYAPGTAAWFRVTAKRAGLSSLPSDPASVYAPTAAARVQLKVA